MIIRPRCGIFYLLVYSFIDQWLINDVVISLDYIPQNDGIHKQCTSKYTEVAVDYLK
jgi:hypothetical protein